MTEWEAKTAGYIRAKSLLAERLREAVKVQRTVDSARDAMNRLEAEFAEGLNAKDPRRIIRVDDHSVALVTWILGGSPCVEIVEVCE